MRTIRNKDFFIRIILANQKGMSDKAIVRAEEAALKDILDRAYGQGTYDKWIEYTEADLEKQRAKHRGSGPLLGHL